MKNSRSRTVLSVMLAMILLTLVIAPTTAEEPAKISRFGKYSGYSEPLYDEWVRTSQYATVRDGTKLALDILRPSVDGVPVVDPLPVAFAATRYQRARVVDGQVVSLADIDKYECVTLLQHGYVVAVADMRGSGASYGTRVAETTELEAQDTYDLIEWMAEQPWCDGNVGMIGCSYVGLTQHAAAIVAPPHLKAIFPAMAAFDFYETTFNGGIAASGLDAWDQRNRSQDMNPPAPPVDADVDGSMKAEAVLEHADNMAVWEVMSQMLYRDSWMSTTNKQHYLVRSPGFNNDKYDPDIAIYLWGGWNDPFRTESFVYTKNLDNPLKLTLGQWYHCTGSEFWATEQLRWFDYWLKGIDNGIMDEPSIHYEVRGAPEGDEWRSTSVWPLPNEKRMHLYFVGGPSGSIDSVNDGDLSLLRPENVGDKDDYTVDYTCSLKGLPSQRQPYGFLLPDTEVIDFTPNDRKGLTYTTPPLTSDVEMTGHPVVHLWVSSTAPDGDFFVYLQEVDENGVSQCITDGILRASHRALGTPPFDNMGLPYQTHLEEDVADLPPNEPVELVFDLLADSNIFQKGHRIRVTITCVDTNNFVTPELSPTPIVSVYRNNEYASYIDLPLIGVDFSAGFLEHSDSGIEAWVIVVIVFGCIIVIGAIGVMVNRARKQLRT